MTSREIKADICRHFKLKPSQLSVRQTQGTGRYISQYDIRTQDAEADAKGQVIYDYLREHKDRFGLRESVDTGYDMDYGPPYNIRLDVWMEKQSRCVDGEAIRLHAQPDLSTTQPATTVC